MYGWIKGSLTFVGVLVNPRNKKNGFWWTGAELGFCTSTRKTFRLLAHVLHLALRFHTPKLKTKKNATMPPFRHQWSVSNALRGSQSWDLGSLNCFKGPQDPVPGLRGVACMTYLPICFAAFFCIHFSDFNTKKNIPKWSPNRPKIDEK